MTIRKSFPKIFLDYPLIDKYIFERIVARIDTNSESTIPISIDRYEGAYDATLGVVGKWFH